VSRTITVESFILQKVSRPEVTKNPRDGLTGGPDRLGDFLVSERRSSLNLALLVSMAGAPVQQKASEPSPAEYESPMERISATAAW
jgi:hypothetical protein